MFRALMVVLALLSFCGSLAANEAAGGLVSPAVLNEALFNSGPITTTDAKGKTAQLVFAPGGVVKRVPPSGRAVEGTWRLSDNGFCMKMNSAKREGCYLVLRRTDGRLAVMKVSGQEYVWQR